MSATTWSRPTTSPHAWGAPRDSGGIMREVMLALLPGTALAIWFFGPGVAINVLIAILAALLTEAAFLRFRQRSLRPLGDGSAALAGWLLALCLPPLAPWWLPALGSVVAVGLAKQLYGGLGFNPFNPAMAGYVILLVSFPREFSLWLPAGNGNVMGGLSWLDSLRYSGTGQLPAGLAWDAMSAATPLAASREARVSAGGTVDGTRQINQGAHATQPGASGGVWAVVLGYLAGGLYLLWRGVIRWQAPVAFLVSLALLASVFWLFDPARFLAPWSHLLLGAAVLGAFFIVPDPVSGATSARGRLVFGAGAGALVYLIRTFGGYPDGVAFAVLLMNLAVPFIDARTRPTVHGHGRTR